MNIELMKAYYQPSVMTVENRLAYYDVLDQWMAYGKREPFDSLIAAVVLESLNLMN